MSNLKGEINNSYKILNRISNPQDIKNLSIQELGLLSTELRQETIKSVSKTGGHLGAGLGVVEITTALHYVFNAPQDKIIWDVGHQAYPHKILTGRKEKMGTMRQPSGLSGFTKRSESIYDPFGAGHSSTSISAALGFCVARDLKEEENNIVAIIGDGAISAGMAYEALNNTGTMNSRLIVILNDNDMSIASPVGAMSSYLSKLTASESYLTLRRFYKKLFLSLNNKRILKEILNNKLPNPPTEFFKKSQERAKNWLTKSNIFKDMGLHYIGPIDGHNLDTLVPILQNIRDNKSNRPILIHCITQKGCGYNKIMKSDDCLHAVSKFDLKTGIQDKKISNSLSYSQVFGKTLTKLAHQDKKIVGITAAMPSGTGLNIFAENFNKKGNNPRFFDVGIAEQHAVTFAAGMACEGLKPFVAIYSTFLQRAYDQIVHDVALQKLPVRFAIDRAGFVGGDGPTHAGSFDIAYLINLPNFVLMAASSGNELARMITTANLINDRPSAFRYPRGEIPDQVNFDNILPLEIGKGKIIQEGSKIAVLCYGSILENAIKASQILEQNHNLKITIADARFAKPLDEILILDLAKNHNFLITLEEGIIGGFGSVVTQLLINNGFLNNKNLKFYPMFMKDKFIEHNNIIDMQNEAGIGIEDIISKVLEYTGAP